MATENILFVLEGCWERGWGGGLWFKNNVYFEQPGQNCKAFQEQRIFSLLKSLSEPHSIELMIG